MCFFGLSSRLQQRCSFNINSFNVELISDMTRSSGGGLFHSAGDGENLFDIKLQFFHVVVFVARQPLEIIFVAKPEHLGIAL